MTKKTQHAHVRPVNADAKQEWRRNDFNSPMSERVRRANALQRVIYEAWYAGGGDEIHDQLDDAFCLLARELDEIEHMAKEQEQPRRDATQ
jgi:hypothetical protein